jgi:hypothetical protein
MNCIGQERIIFRRTKILLNKTAVKAQGDYYEFFKACR